MATTSPMNVRWTWHALPNGSTQPKDEQPRFLPHVNDVPAFQTEDFMPPENEMKSRVDFIYSEEISRMIRQSIGRNLARSSTTSLESFIGKRKAMEQAVGRNRWPERFSGSKAAKDIRSGTAVRNVSFEGKRPKQEKKREKEKDPTNVEEVWKKQYGYGRELTWLFLGLARAAGFDASGMWVADRQNYFFNASTMDGRRLDDNVVVVKLNGKDVFFDPGTAFTPLRHAALDRDWRNGTEAR